MKRAAPVENQNCLVNASKVALILTNLCFLVAGSLLVFYGVKVNNSGWLDIFQDQYAWVKSATFSTIIAFGAIILLVSLVGCFGAWNLNKGLLCCYSVFVGFSIVVFIVLCIGGFAAGSTAHDWNSKPYPADQNIEPKIAETFDKIFCYSQAIYLCNSADVPTTINTYYPELNGVSSIFNGVKGINSACSTIQNYLPLITDPKAVEKLQSICDSCKKAADYAKYDQINNWLNDKCPPTTPVAIWCGKLLMTNTIGSYENSPYQSCRSSFLDIWVSWCQALGIGSLIVVIVSIAIMVFACILMRKQSRNQNVASPSRDSVNAPYQGYNNQGYRTNPNVA